MNNKLATVLMFGLFWVSLSFVGKVYAQCVPIHQSCDSTHMCCSFPTNTCQGGYCEITSAQCGTAYRPCCSSPNPVCVSGLRCESGNCIPDTLPTATPFPTAPPTPTPSCGRHNLACCLSAPQCIYPSDICSGGFCIAPPAGGTCGNRGGVCCTTASPCTYLNDVCNASHICVAPTPTTIPAAPPAAGGGGAIQFDELLNAFPGLDTIYKKNDATVVSNIFGAVLPYLFVIAGLILLFMLISGGISMMLSAGNENGIKKAQGQITNALLGFLVLFVSYWIVQIIEAVLGITIF